jgi:hypothetical protein
MSLYQITEEMLSLLEAFDTHGAESEEAEAAIREHAEAIAEAFDAKADSYAALIVTCEYRAANRKAEAKRLRERAEADERLAERLRNAMREAMERTGRKRVETPRYTLSVRTNGGKCPMTVNPEMIPDSFMRIETVRSPDKDMIRAELESGGTVEGATLLPRGTRLDLR